MKAAKSAEVESRASLRRWLAFSVVGAFGFVVQVATLAALTEWTSCNYLPATVFAVEAAVIHNYLWHERWTWGDRVACIVGERLSRFFRFQLTNGLAPMIGNLLLMRLMVGHLGVRPILASLVAVAICSIFTFLAGEHLVFSAPIR
jgi:putative flippase GtrA